jgi:hypothetical protein
MQRLRVSPFQATLLRRVREEQDDGRGHCALTSRNSKRAIYGRAGGFTAAQRVTLHRSIRRLVASGMIEPVMGGLYRITPKGRTWLAAREEG